jgi:hypothetical protein
MKPLAGWRVAALLALAVTAGGAAPEHSPPPRSAFEVSYAAGTPDASGQIVGGTEARNLAAHAGKLYAGIGYWEDRPVKQARGATILVLDSPGGRWQVQHTFADRMPNGRPRHFAISALRSVRFSTDRAGHRLVRPVSILLAASWDHTGANAVFSLDDATGAWSEAVLSRDPPRPHLPQVRSLGEHRDRVTSVDRVFAGTDPRGIFSGAYDPSASGRIAWGSEPELDLRTLHADEYPGVEGRLRVSSFAECNGSLYAAVGQQVWQRIDGAKPQWRKIYSNPQPHYSQTGLRGLTAIANPAGPGQVLLAAVEGRSARIVRIDPRDGRETTDLDLSGLLDREWQTRVSYVISAYNDMAKVDGVLLIGLEAFIPPLAPRPPGHLVLDVINGLEGGSWYLVRHRDGRYDLRQITVSLPEIGSALVAPRAILSSPFPHDDHVYFAGYDANHAPAHNTAWIVRAPLAAAVAPPPPRSHPPSTATH